MNWMLKVKKIVQSTGKLKNDKEKQGEQESAVTSGQVEYEQQEKINPKLPAKRVIKMMIRGSKVRHEAPKAQGEDVQTTEQYEEAVAECQQALRDWRSAQRKLDWALEADEIDYAIYSLIAAEKHYASALKETKRIYRAMKSAAN